MSKFTEKYQTLLRDSNVMDEWYDCAVMAIAVLGDLSYLDSHRLFETLGRGHRKTVSHHQTLQALASLDLDTEDQTALWRDLMGGRTVRTLARVMKGQKGKWMVRTAQHVFAMEDGEVHDWTAGRLHRILKVSKVTSATAARSPE
jgi:hypothetical protein